MPPEHRKRITAAARGDFSDEVIVTRFKGSAHVENCISPG
jgi:hypothetical protein